MPLSSPPGRWAERRLKSASRADVLSLALIALVAIGAVAAGRRAHRSVEPRKAPGLAGLLDELDMPLKLPNAPLADADGNSQTLLERIHRPRAVITFYASWCGPCQKELPQLHDDVGSLADLLVVVSPDEDTAATRRALDNLNLTQLRFFVDTTGRLQKEGRVKGLPTTFLVNQTGSVLERAVGFSFMELYRLKSRLKPQGEPP
jgi:thiol-disulfide isomerase/thioredoxin